MTRGYTSSEHWLSVVAMVAVVVLSVTNTATIEAITAITTLASVYTAGRSYVKTRGGDDGESSRD